VSLCDFENASDTVTIRAAKPEVLAFARSAEVEISRNLTDYYSDPAIKSCKIKDTGTLCSDKLTNTVPQPVAGSAVPPLHRPLLSLLSVQPQDRANGSLPMHTVAIAIGTNLGDRFANIERALRFLEDPYRLFPLHKDAVVSIIDTSFMYETAPMYVTDQPMFINCTCLVRHTKCM
jgi:dihydroneopterin aldolase / 2-amino-4-hydroxy-6-hydroxymethyldihydropteridine diphosphokinase / dihydropteroate synthase